MIVLISFLSFASNGLCKVGIIDDGEEGGGLSLTSPLMVYDVRTYGAVGDGAHDDTAAIQAALNAASANSGLVWLPAGIYLVSNPLVVKSNTALSGVGRGSQIKAATLSLPAIGEPYEWGMSAIIYVQTNATNCAVHDLFIKGAWTRDQPGGTTNGILLGEGVTNCRIDGNWVEGASWSGILTHGVASSGHVITGNHVADCAVDGIEIWGSRTVVSGNYISDCGLAKAQGTATDGVGGIEVAAVPGSSAEDIIIANNVIYGGRGGITSASGGVLRLVITGNTIRATEGRGINLYGLPDAPLTDVVVSHNIVSNTVSEWAFGWGIGIGAETDGFSVHDNNVSNCGAGKSDGIVIEGTATRGRVESNVVTGCHVGIGIIGIVDGPTDIQVIGNTVTDIREGGVPIVDEGTNTTVVGNKTTTNDKDYRLGSGGYNTGHIMLGAYHLWIDAAGKLRIKSSAPAFDTDGTVVGTQGDSYYKNSNDFNVNENVLR